MQSSTKHIIAITLACLIGVSVVAAKVYIDLIPKSAHYLAHKLPNPVLETLGESTLKGIDRDELATTHLTQAKQDELTNWFEKSLQGTTSDYEYQLLFRHVDGIANAFALPGGIIILSDTLVTELTQKELEAVILHEMAHIDNRHMTQSAIRSSLLYIGILVAFSDVSGVGDLLLSGGHLGLNAHYSREFERQADMQAAQVLIRRYQDAEPLASALERLHSLNSNQQGAWHEQWLSSHPDISERIKTIRALTPSKKGPPMD